MDTNTIPIASKKFIRKIGKDEYWLQDLIYKDPKILGLGNLIAVNKEKKQSSGGRLDLLLKEPEQNAMYEVEIMLGETDPSHIIRSIEYWDNEKRKYPQRQHFCVLIAESFDRRYFNILQILSLNIPMIAIQADLLEVNGTHILNFTKLVDIYIEPEENDDEAAASESTWQKDAPWVNDGAHAFYEMLKPLSSNLTVRYTQSYISVSIASKNTYWFSKRSKPMMVLFFIIKDDEHVAEVKQLLELEGISYSYTRYKEFMITLNIEQLKVKKTLWLKIHNIRFGIKAIAEED